MQGKAHLALKNWKNCLKRPKGRQLDKFRSVLFTIIKTNITKLSSHLVSINAFSLTDPPHWIKFHCRNKCSCIVTIQAKIVFFNSFHQFPFTSLLDLIFDNFSEKLELLKYSNHFILSLNLSSHSWFVNVQPILKSACYWSDNNQFRRLLLKKKYRSDYIKQSNFNFLPYEFWKNKF